MATPFMGEVKMVGFAFPPKGWAQCNGQILAIAQNQALFSLLGTTYGGNGVNTFGLPDLRSRTAFHFGNGGEVGSYSLGQVGGRENHTLLMNEMPQHTHVPMANNTAPNQGDPTGNTWATPAVNTYAAASDSNMNPGSIGNAGGSQPHNNMPPYLVVNFVIALVGVFPSRN